MTKGWTRDEIDLFDALAIKAHRYLTDDAAKRHLQEAMVSFHTQGAMEEVPAIARRLGRDEGEVRAFVESLVTGELDVAKVLEAMDAFERKAQQGPDDDLDEKVEEALTIMIVARPDDQNARQN